MYRPTAEKPEAEEEIKVERAEEDAFHDVGYSGGGSQRSNSE